VAAVLDSPATGIGFYHYAMMPLNRLDWIRRALGRQAPGEDLFVAQPAGEAS
jgi:hypothetical protein